MDDANHKGNENKPINKLPGRILCIDYGLARIGLAVSDPNKIIATSLATIASEKKIEQTALKLKNEITLYEEKSRCHIEEIVIGLPLRMNGTMGMMADEVRLFAELLQQQVSCPVITWDERLSTVQAERAMIEGGMSRKKRSQIVDKVTAVIILQSYLSSKTSVIY